MRTLCAALLLATPAWLSPAAEAKFTAGPTATRAGDKVAVPFTVCPFLGTKLVAGARSQPCTRNRI
jgi:hypothetical protein